MTIASIWTNQRKAEITRALAHGFHRNSRVFLPIARSAAATGLHESTGLGESPWPYPQVDFDKMDCIRMIATPAKPIIWESFEYRLHAFWGYPNSSKSLPLWYPTLLKNANVEVVEGYP